jgi:hypothetical protein
MRPLLTLLCACLAALGAATAGASEAAPAVSVSVTPASVRAVSGGRTPSGRRDYTVSFRVTANSEQQCANLLVVYSYTALFNGRRSLAGSRIDYYETNAPATSASFDVHAPADAADVVAFSGHATCEDEQGGVIARSPVAAARITVAAHSCEQGPLRVLGVRGSVRREDLLSRAAVPVRAGHHLWTGYHVLVARRGRIAFGAGECHALRVVVDGPVNFVPGDYSRRSYGTSTLLGYGATADFRGDQHSGGVETANAVALPRGTRAGPSKLARFEIVSMPKRLGRVTRVRVRRGTVYVAPRTRGRYGTAIVLRAGQSTVVRCATVCRATRG